MNDLNLKPESTVRVYCDIDVEAELKIRFRLLQLRREMGRRITRKEYMEKLITDDLAKVKGASFREVKQRR